MSDRPANTAIHVLLVEDHVQLRKVLKQTLCGEGFRVTTAESADQALSILGRGEAVDILFSDVRMPGRLDGLQLARWVQEHRPEIMILLQTGFSDMDTGNFRVLRKPFSPDELSAQLRATLERDSPCNAKRSLT